jgi:cell division protein FtsB
MPIKKEKAHSILKKLLLAIGLGILIFSAISISRETYRKKQIQTMIDKLNYQSQQIEKEKADIAEKISYFKSQDYQKQQLKDKFNMQEPGENVVIIKPSISKELQNEEKGQPEIQPKEQARPNPIKWWNHFFKY